MVFADNVALQHSFDPKAQFLHVTCGTIQAHGEEKTSILAQFETMTRPKISSNCLKSAQPFRPTNMFQDMTIQHRVETDGL